MEVYSLAVDLKAIFILTLDEVPVFQVEQVKVRFIVGEVPVFQAEWVKIWSVFGEVQDFQAIWVMVKSVFVVEQVQF